jgi:hypothetical protein
MRHDVIVTDIGRAPPRPRPPRLLNFLGEFGSVGEEAVFHGGPLHPLTPLLGEQKFKMAFKEYWMVRILDVASALAARGYLPGVHGELHFDVGDDLFPENAGRYVLHVNDGRGTVRRGGNGTVRLNVRALASLYTGFASPHSLKMLGRIEGDDASLRAASAVFAGAPPSCRTCSRPAPQAEGCYRSGMPALIETQNLTGATAAGAASSREPLHPRGLLYGFLGPNARERPRPSASCSDSCAHLAAKVFGQDCWKNSHAIKGAEVGYIPGDLRLYPWMKPLGLAIVGARRGRGPARAGRGTWPASST